jgi:transglutaminase-like putative cysteine protease
MLLRIRHTTVYRYHAPVTDSHTLVRLMPLTDSDQTCLDFRLTTNPAAPVFTFAEVGGPVHTFNIRGRHTSLEITMEARVETRLANPFEGVPLLEDDWPYYQTDAVREGFAEYLAPTRLVPLEPATKPLADTARHSSDPAAASFLLSLNRVLHDTLQYDSNATGVDSTLQEVLESGRGVCQDYAHLMLAVCRGAGIPARYVSGYVLSADGVETHAEQATHAWVECLLPGGLWRGFDPTNNLLANDRYVKAHIGRDYYDAAPTRGIYRGKAEQSLEVAVEVATA